MAERLVALSRRCFRILSITPWSWPTAEPSAGRCRPARWRPAATKWPSRLAFLA